MSGDMPCRYTAPLMDPETCQDPIRQIDVHVCIPARWRAARFPGKLLAAWRGGSVLGATAAIAVAADLGPVSVVVDDDRLAGTAEAVAGVSVVRSGPEPRNGTERLAAALARGALGAPEIVVNLQGDAVGATPDLLRRVVSTLRSSGADLATVAVGLAGPAPVGRTSASARGEFAADFSRHPLPSGTGHCALVHVGIYAYRAEALLHVAALPRTPREREEGLEQLRWLEHDLPIALAVVDGPSTLAHAVDTPRDLERG